ncbi:MAG: gliding motility-associated C-terminal domain-containing protein [Bacteroidales bacterium]|nr:gliding motility-associated C-terminal domain-containing protein [Bacteroidales bacterium]
MNIENIFKQKLSERKVNASSDLWNKLEGKLNTSATNITGHSQSFTPTGITTAVKATIFSIAGAVVVAGGYLIIDNLTENDNKIKDKTETVTANDINRKDIITEIYDNSGVTVAVTPDVEKKLNSSQANTPEPSQKTTSEKTDFSAMIANQNTNSNITLNFDVTPINTDKSITHNYEPTIKKTEVKNDVNQTSIGNDPVHTAKIFNHAQGQKTIFDNLTIPNLITPNNDGINDFFVIGNLNLYPDNVLVIWNRAGKQLYSQSNYRNDWDAQNLPSGTYFYKLLIRSEGKSEIKSGIIEVMR